jgi:hypothetical protein
MLFFISLLQLIYLERHPELSDDQIRSSWAANFRRWTFIPMGIVVTSIAISFYNPNLAMRAFWLLLVFHFYPGNIAEKYRRRRVGRNPSRVRGTVTDRPIPFPGESAACIFQPLTLEFWIV